MVDRIPAFTVTTAANTLSSAPATTTLTFPDGIVRGIHVRVPPGPSGLMGFYVAYAGISLIPDSGATWLLMDDEQWEYAVDNHPTGSQWQVVSYNEDPYYAHSVYLRFLVDEFPTPAPASPSIQPIPLGG